MAAHQPRRIRIKAVRRHPPDLKKLSRALIGLAQAQAEQEAETEHWQEETSSPKRRAKRSRS